MCLKVIILIFYCKVFPLSSGCFFSFYFCWLPCCFYRNRAKKNRENRLFCCCIFFFLLQPKTPSSLIAHLLLLCIQNQQKGSNSCCVLLLFWTFLLLFGSRLTFPCLNSKEKLLFLQNSTENVSFPCRRFRCKLTSFFPVQPTTKALLSFSPSRCSGW